MCFEAFLHSLETIHGIGIIFYFYDSIGIAKQYITVRHFNFFHFYGGLIRNETYPKSESSWNDFFYGSCFFSVNEHGVMARSDKRKFFIGSIEFKKYGCNKYTSFEFLLQFIIENNEKFLKRSDFF